MYNANLSEVSVFDAKTHLSQLLARVQQGNRITITRHNMPVAMLVPFQSFEPVKEENIIEQMFLARKGRKLERETLRAFKEEGRRP